MKKVLIVLVVGFMCFGCSVQNANAQSSNDAQRIIGTWTNPVTNTTFVFNSDGTYTSSGDRSNGNGNYFYINSKIFLRQNNSRSARVFECYLAPNGRILVIHLDEDSEGFWFEKR